jgi:polyisoprenoid-binding protein YceI
MSSRVREAHEVHNVEQTRWRLDPTRSRVEFHTGNFWGLTTVKGHFDRFGGVLDLSAQWAIELTLDVDSLDTSNAKRDKHLRSADFFDAADNPQVRYLAKATLAGERLTAKGVLLAGGTSVPVEVEATLRQTDGELEVDAVTQVDHRALGMTWSPLGIVRGSSTVIVRGRLVRDTTNEDARAISRLPSALRSRLRGEFSDAGTTSSERPSRR